MCYHQDPIVTAKYRNVKIMWRAFCRDRKGVLRSYFHPQFKFAHLDRTYEAEPPRSDELICLSSDCVTGGVFHGFLSEDDLREALREWKEIGRGPFLEPVIMYVEIIEFHSAGVIPNGFFGQGRVAIGATKIRIPKNPRESEVRLCATSKTTR